MLGVVDQVCSKGLLLMPGMPKPSVALVVGSAHLPGATLLNGEGGATRGAQQGGGYPSASTSCVMLAKYSMSTFHLDTLYQHTQAAVYFAPATPTQ